MRAASLLAVGFVLSGCSGASLGSSDWFPSMPGFSRVASSSADASAMAAATPATISMEDNCPIVDIRAGAGTLAITTAGKGQQATANDVRYQLTFTQLARQCAQIGTTIKMRVGVQGRAIAGPAGAPNQVEVPLRYAVVREGVEPKTITTKFRRIPLALPPGNGNVLFTDIEEDLSFPMPPRDELEAYIVYVGFDDVGDRNERRPATKKGKAK